MSSSASGSEVGGDRGLTDAGDAPDRAYRRALTLEWVTIAWNVVEIGVTIGLGVAAGSLALVAFGLDSGVEIFASLVVVWHLRGDQASGSRMAFGLRLVAVAFFALAAVLAVGGVARLASGTVPDEAPLGIAYLALTLLVMLGLARAKAAVGRQLGAGPLTSEARVTYLDAGLAGGVLAALVLNAWLGWWWADPLAALGVATIAVVEGRANLAEAAEIVAGDLEPMA